MSPLLITPVPALTSDPFHWTVEKFYRASDAGVFDEPKQWEIAHGNLWKKELINPPHAQTTGDIADLLRSVFTQYRVREEKPIHLSPDTELMPDVAVVLARQGGYRTHHPGPDDVLLLVEIADTSVQRDTVEKALLYAQAGIADYWVSLIGVRELVVFREPTPAGYAAARRLTEADTVRPLAAPDVELPVRDLVAPLSPHADEEENPDGDGA